MSDVTAAVLGSLFAVAVICGTIAFLYLYCFFKRNKRLPWHEAAGISYCPPEAKYNEIDDIRAALPRNAYDYAVVDELSPQIIVRGKDKDEYDHLGEHKRIGEFAAVRYDTTASTVQIVASAENSRLEGEPLYSYNHLAQNPNPKVPHNSYDAVALVESTPRSSTVQDGGSPNYNLLVVARPDMHLSNEYDKPATQGTGFNEHEVGTVLAVSSSEDTHETFGGINSNMSDEQKSIGVYAKRNDGRMDSGESIEMEHGDQRIQEREHARYTIYQLAAAMDAPTVQKSIQSPTYEDVQSLGENHGQSKPQPKKPRVLKRGQAYNLASLPSGNKITVQREVKIEKMEIRNMIKQFEKSPSESGAIRNDQTSEKEGNSNVNSARVKSAIISTTKPEKSFGTGRLEIEGQISSIPIAKPVQKPSIIPRRSVSSNSRKQTL